MVCSVVEHHLHWTVTLKGLAESCVPKSHGSSTHAVLLCALLLATFERILCFCQHSRMSCDTKRRIKHIAMWQAHGVPTSRPPKRAMALHSHLFLRESTMNLKSTNNGDHCSPNSWVTQTQVCSPVLKNRK